jgi:hypothetical protein
MMHIFVNGDPDWVVFHGSLAGPATRSAMSRSVNMPQSLPFVSVSKQPTLYRSMSRQASVIFASEDILMTGLRQNSCSDMVQFRLSKNMKNEVKRIKQGRPQR